jgi:glycerophosphoryl diester phosphodiesterase
MINHLRTFVYLLFVLLPCATQAQTTTLNTLTQVVIDKGHAHNDYEHERPLMQALELGYRSVEVDVWLHDGQLKVSHDNTDLDKKPTLQTLYLEPLKNLYKTAFRYKLTEAEPLVLMIDIKSDAEETYALRRVLAQYDPILTKYTAGKAAKNNLISVLVSGNKPLKDIAAETESYVTMDVNFTYANTRATDKNITRVSSDYSDYFKWNGIGTMPKEELEKLIALVKDAHAQQRDIRFWAAPNTAELWKTFLDAGVDWINTDKLEEFQQFYIGYTTKK